MTIFAPPPHLLILKHFQATHILYPALGWLISELVVIAGLPKILMWLHVMHLLHLVTACAVQSEVEKGWSNKKAGNSQCT